VDEPERYGKWKALLGIGFEANATALRADGAPQCLRWSAGIEDSVERAKSLDKSIVLSKLDGEAGCIMDSISTLP
jgi:hypothetical protein